MFGGVFLIVFFVLSTKKGFFMKLVININVVFIPNYLLDFEKSKILEKRPPKAVDLPSSLFC